eukprot:5730209-Prorocentrum_lima.AAC.1
MTSSLVGSEMCIRDRQMRGLPAALRLVLCSRAWRGICGTLLHTLDFAAVSYTHLTLPTICSV